MSGKKILAGLLCAALLISGIIWLAGSGSENPHWTLSDGSVLELVKVSYGAGLHQARAGQRLRDYFYPVLSRKLQVRFGLNVASYSTTDPAAIVLWFRRTKDKQPVLGGAVEMAALDANGLEGMHAYLQQSGSSGIIWITTASGARMVRATPDPVYPAALTDYPRRSRDFPVRVYYRDYDGKVAKVGEFTLANRLRNHSPGWQPETLPATRKTNSLEIKLLQLQAGFARSGPRFGAVGSGDGSHAVFEFHENGKPATNWVISDIHLSAATGVDLNAENRNQSWEGVEHFFDFVATLWPEEPAWKLRVHLVQISDFSADELWVLKGVPVPGAWQTVDVHAVTNISGKQLELVDMRRGFAGVAVGTVKIKPNLPAREVSPRRAVIRVTDIKDEQGRSVRNGIYPDPNLLNLDADNSFAFQATDLGNAKTIDITFVFPKEIFVEFLAKPVVAPASKTK